MIFGSAPPLTGRGITVGSHRGAPAGMPTWIHDVDGVDSVDPGVMDGAWANVCPGGIYIYIILLGMYSGGGCTLLFFLFCSWEKPSLQGYEEIFCGNIHERYDYGTGCNIAYRTKHAVICGFAQQINGLAPNWWLWWGTYYHDKRSNFDSWAQQCIPRGIPFEQHMDSSFTG